MRENLKHMKIYRSPSEGILNLANNENHYSSWNKDLNNEFNDAMGQLRILEYGPDVHYQLVEAYAKYAKVESRQIMVGSGTDSIIPLLIQAISSKTILTLETDFFRYSQQAEIINRQNIKVSNSKNMYDEIIKQVKLNDVELIILSNPNNPLGLVHKKEDLLKILDNVACHVIIDEAYWEFCNETMVSYLEKYPKLIILRTMSKAWGIANLRIGFALAHSDLINYLMAIQGPFTISCLNANLATEVLKNEAKMKEMVSKILVQRQRLTEFLVSYLNIKVYESKTNFIYFEHEKALEIQQKLMAKKILVGCFPPLGLRITIGNERGNTKLIEALAKILEEVA